MTAFAAVAALGGLAAAVPLAGTASAATGSQTFTYTGGPQAFTVPAGATSLHVVVTGGSGGNSTGPDENTAVAQGGAGAVVTADFPVSASGVVQPGEDLVIQVANYGATSGLNYNSTAGGYGGGGAGGTDYGLNGLGYGAADGGGAGGGGASEITGPDGTALVVAGGGGGAGSPYYQADGGAGGAAGVAGGAGGGYTAGAGGGAGTLAAGGQGASGAGSGMLGLGGAGAPNGTYVAGGGGGGGYYGGGGGGASGCLCEGGGGGGGGSSYTVASAQNVSQATTNIGVGSVTITWTYTPPTITTTSLPGGTVGTAYSQTLAASGGTSPYTWSVSTGSLPAGLSLDTSTGVISGTPTTAQSASFTVMVTDAADDTASQSLSIAVVAAPTACTNTITGTHSTVLAVTSGITCLTGATQNGGVTVDAGAGLIVTDSKVNGTVTATGASEVEYCGSTQSGTLKITGTTGNVTLGDGASCAADTIPSLITVTGTGGQVTVNGVKENGTLTLEDNTGGVTLNGSDISGLVYLEDNAGTAVTVAGNTVDGSLTCTGNNPAPGDGGSVNTVTGTASGQCATLAER